MKELWKELEVDGYRFNVYLQRNEHANPPWKEDCWYDGVVTERSFYWRGDRPQKAPHERILFQERGHALIFDVKRFMEIAIKDGCTPEAADRQAKEGFERLRRWCNDDWWYVGVIVEAADDPELFDSIWRIESDCEDYILEWANDLARGLAAGIKSEAEEGFAWACRDTLTMED